MLENIPMDLESLENLEILSLFGNRIKHSKLKLKNLNTKIHWNPVKGLDMEGTTSKGKNSKYFIYLFIYLFLIINF